MGWLKPTMLFAGSPKKLIEPKLACKHSIVGFSQPISNFKKPFKNLILWNNKKSGTSKTYENLLPTDISVCFRNENLLPTNISVVAGMGGDGGESLQKLLAG